MLTDTAARWLLLLHTALGVAAVGASTHLAIWVARVVRGQHRQLAGVRRFSRITLALQVLAFTAGAILYPTYKVEVRAAYLEDREALVADQASHQRQLARLAAREHAEPPAAADLDQVVRGAARAARWFDIKEHWIALGILAALALQLVVTFWTPREAGRELGPVLLALASIVTGTLWLGAIVGVVTASWRAL